MLINKNSNCILRAATSKSSASSIETLCEAFADGSFIEPVHDQNDRDTPQLMLWDGKKAKIASNVQHAGHIYAARRIDLSIVRELNLPTEIYSNESVSKLVADLAEIFQRFTGLSFNSARLLARFAAATWVMEALPARRLWSCSARSRATSHEYSPY